MNVLLASCILHILFSLVVATASNKTSTEHQVPQPMSDIPARIDHSNGMSPFLTVHINISAIGESVIEENATDGDNSTAADDDYSNTTTTTTSTATVTWSILSLASSTCESPRVAGHTMTCESEIMTGGEMCSVQCSDGFQAVGSFICAAGVVFGSSSCLAQDLPVRNVTKLVGRFDIRILSSSQQMSAHLKETLVHKFINTLGISINEMLHFDVVFEGMDNSPSSARDGRNLRGDAASMVFSVRFAILAAQSSQLQSELDNLARMDGPFIRGISDAGLTINRLTLHETAQFHDTMPGDDPNSSHGISSLNFDAFDSKTLLILSGLAVMTLIIYCYFWVLHLIMGVQKKKEVMPFPSPEHPEDKLRETASGAV